MNIGMLVSNFLPRQGGAEYVVHHLTTSLLAAGHCVTVLAANLPRARRIEFPYPVRYAPRIPLLSLECQRLLHASREVARNRFDVLHAHIAWEAGFVGSKLKPKFDIPFVLTPHGGDVQTVPEIGYGLCLKPELRAKVQTALHTADRVTAVSQRIMRAVTNLGCDPNRVRLIHPGTEYDSIQRVETDDLRPKLGWRNGDFIVLSVGRNSPVKDMPTLLKAVQIAAREIPNIRCLMVGPDESLRNMAGDMQLTERVRLLGRIPSNYDPARPSSTILQTPYAEMIAAYRACDVFVSTSYMESFNTAALDAFSCGKPVIVTNTQGFTDVLSEGINGYSVPPHDPDALARKLVELAGNGELRTRMGQAAQQAAKNYDWSKVAQRFLTVYEEAVALCSGSITND